MKTIVEIDEFISIENDEDITDDLIIIFKDSNNKMTDSRNVNINDLKVATRKVELMKVSE